MSVSRRPFTRPKLIVRGGGGAFPHQNSGFVVATRLYCYHEGAWNYLAIGTEENSEIVRSTYLSPSLKFAYGTFISPIFSLDPFKPPEYHS
jgi:hypothetical protein